MLEPNLNRSRRDPPSPDTPPSGARANWVGRPWRLEVGVETLLLGCCLYFVLVLNGPFWRALFAERPLSGLRDLGYGVAVDPTQVRARG